MSKSLGTVVDPLEAADRFGADPLRLYLDQGDRVRRRRRLLVGALRGALQRRPGEQPRQPGQPRDGDGGAVPRRTAGADRRRRRTDWRASATRRWPTTGARWTRFALHEAAAAAFRLVDAANEFIAETRAVGAGEGPGRGRPPDAGAVRRGRSHAARGRAAVAGHAGVGRGDSAARRRVRRDDARLRPRRPLAARRRARDRAGRTAVAAHRSDATRGPISDRRHRHRRRHPALRRQARTGTPAPGARRAGGAQHRGTGARRRRRRASPSTTS